MMVFSVCVILVLWVMQIVFLDDFYYHLTKGRIRQSSTQLMLSTTDTVQERAEDLAVNSQMSVRVFTIDAENNAKKICDIAAPGSALHAMDADLMNRVYHQVLERNGSVTLHFDLTDMGELLLTEAPDFWFGGGNKTVNLLSERLVFACVHHNVSGDLLFVLIDTPLTPVTSTVSTLKAQLFIISAVLLIISTVVALVLSVRISRPMRKLTVAAKELASGNYRADFNEGRGYLEVAELSDTLSYAADELGKVDRLQKELISNISHDLRTPLTMIIGYGEMMRDIEGENTPENVQVIIDEATRLSSLVNDLLEISTLQSGNQSIAREPFDAFEIISDVCTRYQRLKEHNGYEITFEGDKNTYIFADKKKILQVVCNLINNAITYSGEDKRILVCAKRMNDSVRVSVTDHGCGIPEEELANIWQRYYKVDKTHVRSVSGSGLGLSIVRQILELHGARYGVDSRLGVGSSFWFELPEYTANNDHSQ